MKTNRGNIDPGTIIGGLVLILIIGIVISVSVSINHKMGSSIQSGMLAGSTTADAYSVIGNSTKSVGDSLSLAANIPILVIATLMILVLLSVAATLI